MKYAGSKLLSIKWILSSALYVSCIDMSAENSSNQQLPNTVLSQSHRDEILHCIQCDRFVLYSLNLGDSEINQVINKNKHKELRKLIYKGVSTGAITAIAEQNIERKEECALRIQLLPQTYDGKNIELIFPQFKSKKMYSISINVEILEQIKKFYSRIRSC